MCEGMFDDLEGNDLVAALGNLAAIVKSEMLRQQETLDFVCSQRDYYECRCQELMDILFELGIPDPDRLTLGQLNDIRRETEKIA